MERERALCTGEAVDGDTVGNSGHDLDSHRTLDHARTRIIVRSDFRESLHRAAGIDREPRVDRTAQRIHVKRAVEGGSPFPPD